MNAKLVEKHCERILKSTFSNVHIIHFYPREMNQGFSELLCVIAGARHPCFIQVMDLGKIVDINFDANSFLSRN